MLDTVEKCSLAFLFHSPHPGLCFFSEDKPGVAELSSMYLFICLFMNLKRSVRFTLWQEVSDLNESLSKVKQTSPSLVLVLVLSNI